MGSTERKGQRHAGTKQAQHYDGLLLLEICSAKLHECKKCSPDKKIDD
jgi:hypothetical protein